MAFVETFRPARALVVAQLPLLDPEGDTADSEDSARQARGLAAEGDERAAASAADTARRDLDEEVHRFDVYRGDRHRVRQAGGAVR